MDARLWAGGEDPGLQSELRGEYTRPKGDCHEHAARFDRTYTIGEGPGLNKACTTSPLRRVVLGYKILV